MSIDNICIISLCVRVVNDMSLIQVTDIGFTDTSFVVEKKCWLPHEDEITRDLATRGRWCKSIYIYMIV